MKFILFFSVIIAAALADVSHLPSSEYLPPAASEPEPVFSAPAPVEHIEVAASEPEPAHELAADGYRYKTLRRRVYRRHRRDVSHLPSAEYLPPAASEPEPVFSAPAPVEHVEVAASEPEPAHELAADGYRYKTLRRRVYRRHRRDVSHLPSAEYLPPAASEPEPVFSAPAPVEHIEVAASEPEPAHELAADGYRYKTLRRRVYRRHRRDVSHLPSAEYLPPAASEPEPVFSAPAPVEHIEVAASEPEPAHELAADGYRYKTQRRRVYRRHRRDISHLPTVEYLPPVAEASAPSVEYLPPVASASVAHYEVAASEPAPAHQFSADDGYRYKTQRRRVYRRNRF